MGKKEDHLLLLINIFENTKSAFRKSAQIRDAGLLEMESKAVYIKSLIGILVRKDRCINHQYLFSEDTISRFSAQIDGN